MGRPLNKKHFGTGAGADFKVRAKLDTGAEGYGFIVKQTATKTFDVNIGGTVGRCVLVDKDTGTLAAGEMTISTRNTTPTVKRVVKIAGRTCTLSDGTVTAWDFNAATAGKVEMEEEADTFSAPVTPVITIGTQPANASVTAPATATFTVAASVAPTTALTYQWQSRANSGGTFANVSGATAASYTTPATVSGDDGKQFRCVVSSAGATSVNSSTATLTVA